MFIVATLLFLLTLAGVIALFQYGARSVYGYTLSPTAVEFRLFGGLIFRIPWREIAAVYPWQSSVRPNAAVFTTLRLGNRIFGRAITIERRSGFPRYFVVTPDDPQAMMEELNSRRRDA